MARSSRTTLNQSCLTAAWQAQRQLTLSQGHPDTGFSLFITRAFHPLETTLLAARAQQPKLLVIGVFYTGSPPELALDVSGPFGAAFRQGLSEAGYFEGRNVALEYRLAENQFDRLPALAANLVRRQVTVGRCQNGG